MPIKLLTTLLLAACLITAYADDEGVQDHVTIIKPYKMSVYDHELSHLIKRLPKGADNLDKRVQMVSDYFKGQPYFEGALGEGPNGKFDKGPLYRTDAFDCVTYVATVLALANSDNLKQFQQQIQRINYKNSQVAYVERNHFMTTDWNPANVHNGMLQDVTYRILLPDGRPAAKVAQTVINKPGWYGKKNLSSLHLFKKPNAEQAQQMLTKLRDQAQQTQQEEGVLLYIPFTALFDKDGQPVQSVFDQIPSPSVIEIVRPNWNLNDFIGTSLNVSHLGFGIREQDNTLIYRNASSTENQVMDIPLEDYLKQYLDSPTIKGINIQQVSG